MMRIDVRRFKEYSGGPDSDKVDITRPQTWKRLKSCPTLLLYEKHTGGPNADVVRYGFIHKFYTNSDFILFQFTEKGRIAKGLFEQFSSRLGLDSFELNRTHWALKEGGIPSELETKIVPRYDAVFSFAGEDRDYVEKVARYLRTKKLNIFYDKFEATNLWGRDLAEHFHMIYGTSGRYCVLFISDAYAKKMWTRHERRTALARALADNSEYILPARFDDTPIEGIRDTIAYIPLSGLKPSQFGQRILKKLGKA